MEKRVLVPIADGSEEIEAVTIIDGLRRAGAKVTVASVDHLQITASRGVRITADCLIEDCVDQFYDLIALPGGMPGAEHLRDDPILKELLLKGYDAGCLCAAICAAPAVVLLPLGMLKNRSATCHPSFWDLLKNKQAMKKPVVVDGNCITSQGPGTALAFTLALIELLYDKQKRDTVAGPMMVSLEWAAQPPWCPIGDRRQRPR